jgi:hypothetical protein
MKAHTILSGLVGTILIQTASAGVATTSAAASSDGYRPGTAVATAAYEGNGVGLTRTNTRSGNVSFARGFSLGFDQNGLSLSNSYAVAPRRGPAVAGTFNLAIGTDGSVSHAVGRTVAAGDTSRGVEASGSARRAAASAAVRGATGSRGHVISKTRSHTQRARTIRRVHRPARLLR